MESDRESLNLAKSNDTLRRSIRTRALQPRVQLVLTDAVKNCRMLTDVMRAFRGYNEFSRLDQFHNAGWFEVRGQLFAFSIEYLSLDGLRLANPEKESFQRRIVISQSNDFEVKTREAEEEGILNAVIPFRR